MGQLADHAEQNIDFGFAERRCGLIQDQDVGIFRQRFGNLDKLLLPDFQVTDQLAWGNRLIEPF